MAKTLDLPITFPFACFAERHNPSFGWMMKSTDANDQPIDRFRRDSFYVDKRGKLRTFDHKRLSRKKGISPPLLSFSADSLRVRSADRILLFVTSRRRFEGARQCWKYGSGFVDGVFPVLSPDAQQLLRFLQEVTDVCRVHAYLDALPLTHDTRDDLTNVAIQLRLNKHWDPIILVRCTEDHSVSVLHKLSTGV